MSENPKLVHFLLCVIVLFHIFLDSQWFQKAGFIFLSLTPVVSRGFLLFVAYPEGLEASHCKVAVSQSKIQ